MIYNIVEAPLDSKVGYQPRGAAIQLWNCKDSEVVISGPAETGKTLAALHKLDALMWKYPGASSVIARKVYKDLHGSVIQTFQKKVLMKNSPVRPYGGEQRPERYIYPNGSVIWLAGMDNPGKVLSSEHDVIYCNQLEEFKENDWEMMKTRTTGRAGHMPHPQNIGDCNPGGSKHWILERAKKGTLKLLMSVHQDNPMLFDDAGNLTEQGKRTMEILNQLTGIRKERLLYGRWVTAEGTVYDMFDAAIHVCVRDPSEFKYWALAIDEGYTNPAVCLTVGIDGDDRFHIYREWYERGKKPETVVKQIRDIYQSLITRTGEDEKIIVEPEKMIAVVADEAAAGLIASLNDVNVPAIGGKGRVMDGIQKVQDLFTVLPDGRPRLTVDPSCVNTINEFESYVWLPGKDEPKKENDHAMDPFDIWWSCCRGLGSNYGRN